jgi:hypothetical protein
MIMMGIERAEPEVLEEVQEVIHLQVLSQFMHRLELQEQVPPCILHLPRRGDVHRMEPY